MCIRDRLKDYLKNLYLQNKLIKPGAFQLDGCALDITKITTPSYFLSAQEDHIAPWRATYSGFTYFTGDKQFTLAHSGHIAGVINPPHKEKYGYLSSQDTPKNAEEWQQSAQDNKGSWWPHWQEWIQTHAGPQVSARPIKKELEKAPGHYVKDRI